MCTQDLQKDVHTLPSLPRALLHWLWFAEAA